MSNRFHNKFHRHNHHTNAHGGEKDSSLDYIGNPSDPFKGDFHITKNLSGHSLSADFIRTDYLSANHVEINVLDLTVTETSGFIAQGNDFNPSPPISVDPAVDPVVLLQNVGLHSNAWVSFGNDLTIGTNVTAKDIKIQGVITNWDPEYIEWNSNYTTVNSLSPVWGPAINEYNSMYTVVCAGSSSWSSTLPTVCAASAIWESTFATTCSISAELQSKDYFNFYPKIGIEKTGTTPSGGYVEFTLDGGLQITPVANSQIFLGGYVVSLSAGPQFTLQANTISYIYGLLASEQNWASNNNAPYLQTYVSTDDLPSIHRRIKLARIETDATSIISLSSITNDTTRLFQSSSSVVDQFHKHYKINDVTFTDRISTSLTITNTSYLEISAEGSIKYLPIYDFS